MTRPHMLGAAPEYQTVDGMHPDVEKHQTFADIEPVRNAVDKHVKNIRICMVYIKTNQILILHRFYYDVHRHNNLFIFFI